MTTKQAQRATLRVAVVASLLGAMPACSLFFGWSDISEENKAAPVTTVDATADAVSVDASDGAALDAGADVTVLVVANADYVVLGAGEHLVQLDPSCVLGRAMLWGAGGQSVNGRRGGQGGFAGATWTIDERTLRVTVGASGGAGPGGKSTVDGGSGGGHTELGIGASTKRLVAGGGGGACNVSNGGAGGGTDGKPGEGDNALWGRPGTPTGGGSGGNAGGNGENGAMGLAGDGGAGGNNFGGGGGSTGTPAGGGGGGSGLFGGGGGATSTSDSKCGGGGGGSGFVDPFFAGTTVSTNNGQVGSAREPHRLARLSGEAGEPGLALVYCGTECSGLAGSCGPFAHCNGGMCHPNGLDSPCNAGTECGGGNMVCNSGRCRPD